MPFDDYFNDIVLDPLKSDAKTREVIASNQGFNSYGDPLYDHYIYSQLERGDASFDTEQLCLWYCYKYLPMHFDQFLALIRKQETIFEDSIFKQTGTVTMVDFGCGPMTSCLAIAEHSKQKYGNMLAINYVRHGHNSVGGKFHPLAPIIELPHSILGRQLYGIAP